MSSSRLTFSTIIFPSLLLASGCTDNMKLKFDAAWEKVDPMGHRSEHQMRHYPRGYNAGMRLPENYKRENPLPIPGSTLTPPASYP